MRPSARVIACLFLSISAVLTAQTSSESAKTNSPNPDRIQIEETLQRYLAAYSHRSLAELFTVWPDLANQKKEQTAIERQFADATVSDERMTVQPIEMDSTSDGALVRAQRTEQFVKTEHVNRADHTMLLITGAPMQDPTQKPIEKKKDVKKSNIVWIALHRNADNWTIVSISEKQPK